MSRTSPANEGGTSGHGNEVPQEYRSDVERIFFEFLNSICSNRTYPCCVLSSGPTLPSSVFAELTESRVRCAPQWMPLIPRASRLAELLFHEPPPLAVSHDWLCLEPLPNRVAHTLNHNRLPK